MLPFLSAAVVRNKSQEGEPNVGLREFLRRNPASFYVIATLIPDTNWPSPPTGGMLETGRRPPLQYALTFIVRGLLETFFSVRSIFQCPGRLPCSFLSCRSCARARDALQKGDTHANDGRCHCLHGKGHQRSAHL